MANEQSTWSPPEPATLSIGKGTAELGAIVVFIDGQTESAGNDHERHRAGHGQEPGADIARHLARRGVPVEVRRASSDGKDVGRVLLSQAAAFGAHLVVMGAYGHSQLREWMFGSVTRTVLYEAGLPVLMSR